MPVNRFYGDKTKGQVHNMKKEKLAYLVLRTMPAHACRGLKHGMWALSEALSGLWGASPTTC